MEPGTLLAGRDAMREQVIAEWAASGVRSRGIAAAWARELLDQDSDQEAGRPVESTMKIARRLGVDNSTAARARRLLVGAGFLRQRSDRHYYSVACPIPREERRDDL